MLRSKLTIGLIATCLFASFNAGAAETPAAAGTAHGSTQGATTINVSGPITLLEGEVMWGGYVSVLHEIVPSFKLGLESGFQYWSTSVGSASASLWNIPVLATGIYQFDLSAAPTFHPFVGAGLGIGIAHGSISTSSVAGSDTEAEFQGLAHLGAAFGAQSGFFVDMRIGVLSSNFLFAPTIGVSF